MAKNQFTLERGEAKALLMCGDRIADTLAGVAALDMFTPDAIVTTGEFEGVF